MIFSDPLDSTTGARCLKLSPDGRHLAAGFRDGNLGVFDITTDKFEQLISVEAHDGEMLCIEYADPQKTDGHTMLASGGRDRLIHLYDAENGYQHLATVEDHSSSVNSIKFIPTSSGFEMFTCATDKLVVIRRVTNSSNGISLERINQFSSPSGLNYLTTAPDGSLIGACQDRQLRTYTINGKMNKQIKGTLCEEGTLTKLALDPSGTYAATVCSDRYVYVIDISTGECAAVLNGQADCVTSIAFTPDCRRLVVVSHSGCVFVWRLSNMLTKRMTTKLGKTEASSSLTTGNNSAPIND
uniref:Anaphase-promoting complex subunit 4 WD40 domain-containing protein n=1 Tax=Panagrolaimus sp. PS1159 TaxID=55785 RepID=A0AC35GKW9_9BILA